MFESVKGRVNAQEEETVRGRKKSTPTIQAQIDPFSETFKRNDAKNHTCTIKKDVSEFYNTLRVRSTKN